MQKILLIFIFIFSSLPSLIGRGQASVSIPDTNRVLFESYGKQGIMTSKGAILLAAKYESLQWESNPNNIQTSIIPYKKNNLWGLIDKDLNILTPPKYKSVIPFNENLIIASIKGKYSQTNFYGLIDHKGKPILSFKYRKLSPAGQYMIVAAKVDEDIKYGLIDRKGKIIIPLEYYQIQFVGNDLFSFTDQSGVLYLALADLPESRIIDQIDSVSSLQNGLAIVYKNGRVGAIDRSGELTLPIKYKNIKRNDGKVLEIKEFREWSVFDNELEQAYVQSADSIQLLDETRLVINCNGRSSIKRKNGGELEIVFDGRLIDTWNKFYLVQSEDQIQVIDTSTLQQKSLFGSYIDHDSYFLITRSKDYEGVEYSIMGIRGNELLGSAFDFNENGTISVQKNGYWGLYDYNLKEVFSPIYDLILPGKVASEYIVKFRGAIGLVGKDAQWIIGPEMRRIEVVDKKWYWVVNKYLEEFLISDDTTLIASLHYEIQSGDIFETNLAGGIRKLNNNAKVVTPFVKGELYALNGNGFLISDQGAFTFFDNSYQKRFSTDKYDSIKLIEKEFFPVLKDGHYGFIDRNGKLRIANRYTQVKAFSEGLAAVKINDRWAYINENEELIIQPYYKKAGSFKEGKAIVGNTKLGMINREGEVLIELDYDTLYLKNKFYLTKKGDKWGFTNIDGKILSYPNYDQVEILNDYIKTKKYGLFSLLNDQGKNILPDRYSGIYYDQKQQVYFAYTESSTQLVFLSDLKKGTEP